MGVIGAASWKKSEFKRKRRSGHCGANGARNTKGGSRLESGASRRLTRGGKRHLCLIQELLTRRSKCKMTPSGMKISTTLNLWKRMILSRGEMAEINRGWSLLRKTWTHRRISFWWLLGNTELHNGPKSLYSQELQFKGAGSHGATCRSRCETRRN